MTPMWSGSWRKCWALCRVRIKGMFWMGFQRPTNRQRIFLTVSINALLCRQLMCSGQKTMWLLDHFRLRPFKQEQSTHKVSLNSVGIFVFYFFSDLAEILQGASARRGRRKGAFILFLELPPPQKNFSLLNVLSLYLSLGWRYSYPKILLPSSGKGSLEGGNFQQEKKIKEKVFLMTVIPL